MIARDFTTEHSDIENTRIIFTTEDTEITEFNLFLLVFLRALPVHRGDRWSGPLF